MLVYVPLASAEVKKPKVHDDDQVLQAWLSQALLCPSAKWITLMQNEADRDSDKKHFQLDAQGTGRWRCLYPTIIIIIIIINPQRSHVAGDAATLTPTPTVKDTAPLFHCIHRIIEFIQYTCSFNHTLRFRGSDLFCKFGCLNPRGSQCKFEGSQQSWLYQRLKFKLPCTHIHTHTHTHTHTQRRQKWGSVTLTTRQLTH